MSEKKPNIVFFLWDNFGWGELGCYGGGVLRGAATPRIDGLAAEGLRLLNFNVEAQCTPSRSAVLTGRHGKVTVSAGVAGVMTGESCMQWVARADAALYAAKQSGRNRVHLAD